MQERSYTYGTERHQSDSRRTSSIFSLCFAARPFRGSVSTTRTGFGCPTRSRAFALTAFVTENLSTFFFATLLLPSCAASLAFQPLQGRVWWMNR